METINLSISYLFFSSKTLIIYRYFPSMATHRIDFSKYFESSSRLKKIPVDVFTLDPIATIDRSGGYTHVLVNKFMRILALCVFARGSRVINARKSVFRNGRPTVSRGTACNSGSVAVQTVLPLTIVARDRPSLIDTGNYWFQPLLDRSPIFWSASFHHSASHSDDVQVILPHPYEYSSAPCPSAKCLIIRFTLGGA